MDSAMRLRRSGLALPVIARNEGMAAKGSTKKKMELSASTENRTRGAVLSALKATSAGFDQITDRG